MSEKRVSASKFDLAAACVFPWTSGIEWDNGKKKWSAVVGTALHKAAETGGHFERDGLTSRQIAVVGGMYQQYLLWESANASWLHGVKKEQKVWYCPDSDKAGLLDSNGHDRDYTGAPDGALVGTADLVFVRELTQEIDVIDIKTGWAPKPPQETGQMMLLSLATSRVLMRDSIEAGILAIREHDHTMMRHNFSDLSLDTTRAKAAKVQLAIAKGAGPTPGEHCHRCPVFHSCEARQQKEEA